MMQTRRGFAAPLNPRRSLMRRRRRMRDLEPDIKAHRRDQPHPAVVGPAKLNEWFDAVIKLANEKIAVEKAASR